MSRDNKRAERHFQQHICMYFLALCTNAFMEGEDTEHSFFQLDEFSWSELALSSETKELLTKILSI